MRRCSSIFALAVIACTNTLYRGARAADTTFLEAIDDAEVKRDVVKRLADLDMFTATGDKLAENVTIQPFVDRQESDDGVEIVQSSFLAVKWPSAPDWDMEFVMYLPDGAPGTMHAVHVCGFLRPEFCANEEPYPGKTQGRCGISDEIDPQKTKFFCDFVTLAEVAEESNGAVILAGSEDLQRLDRHMERQMDMSGGEEQKYPPEIHFEVVELGDEGFDYDDDDLSPAPAPAPESSASTMSSNRRLLIVRGPAFAGMQMTMRAGPGGRRGRNGRSSFVTLPGSLGG